MCENQGFIQLVYKLVIKYDIQMFSHVVLVITTKSRDSEQTSFCARYSEKSENSENY